MRTRWPRSGTTAAWFQWLKKRTSPCSSSRQLTEPSVVTPPRSVVPSKTSGNWPDRSSRGCRPHKLPARVGAEGDSLLERRVFSLGMPVRGPGTSIGMATALPPATTLHADCTPAPASRVNVRRKGMAADSELSLLNVHADVRAVVRKIVPKALKSVRNHTGKRP